MEYPKLSPTSDMLIHYLFTSSGSEPILKSFVNAVLEDSGRPLVKELMINNPFNPKDFMDDKLTIMDISAEDVNGRKFEIEIQKINHPAFVDRILLYWAKEFCGQLQEGDLYQSLTPVVSIVVTEFPLFPMLTDIHNDFYITARKTPDYVLTDDLEMHFIELSTEKTGQIPYLHELLRGWLDFLYYADTEENKSMKILLPKYPELKQAFEKYHRFCGNDELRTAAFRQSESVRLQRSITEGARMEGREEGRAEGREEGRAESLQQYLLKKIRENFPKHYTEELALRIQKVQDVSLLEEWLDMVLDAETFEELEKKMG